LCLAALHGEQRIAHPLIALHDIELCAQHLVKHGRHDRQRGRGTGGPNDEFMGKQIGRRFDRCGEPPNAHARRA